MPKAGKTKPSTKTEKGKKGGEDKERKPPTKYNEFMKTELPKVKKEHPELDHKQAFAQAAKNWGTSKENPKNQK
ncbi:hypothetical protein DFJ74DRAFT_690112 [Hyaloraphidium curvatum]|nr:hypothetical protein DFJ74DRAFT_690112 [Hyaloraphidium curvatum]